MKKGLLFIAMLLLVLSLAACGGNSGSGLSRNETGNSKDESDKNRDETNKEDSGKTGNDNEDKGNVGSTSGGSSGTVEGSISKAQLEQILNDIFAGIGVSNFPVCEAEEYIYSEELDGFIFTTIEIINPKVTIDEYQQMITDSNCGMENMGLSLFGTKWGVRAGSDTIGFSLSTDEDDFSIWLTNYKKEYSQSYIDEKNAKMPKMFPGNTALDVMPEDFTIRYENSEGEYTVLMRSGEDWYHEYSYNRGENEESTIYKFAYMMQPDGSIKRYQNKYETLEWESSGSDLTYEELDEFIDRFFDKEGWNDSFSTWMQLCKDFEDKVNYTAHSRRTMPSELEITGTVTIGDAICDIASVEALWNYQEFVYNQKNGVLLRFRTSQQKDDAGNPIWETHFNTTDYKESADRSLLPAN